MITPGNVDDRVPVGKMTKQLAGKLFGDKRLFIQKAFREIDAKRA